MKTCSNIPIFLPSDNNYAPFAAITMASILDNTQSFIDFYILDGGITLENKSKICLLKQKYPHFSIEFLKIDIEKHFGNFNAPGHLNLATYSRLLIPSLKPDLDKALYMDTDIIVLGDVTELYQTVLENYALGAAWHPTRFLYNTDTKEPMELSDNYKYFNAGVLLIDIQKWTKDKVVENLFEIQRKYNEKIPHADETLLNKYFDGNYKIFDTCWNYTDYDAVNRPGCKVKARHFASPLKPWNSNYFMVGTQVRPLPNFDDFWHYAKMTEFLPLIKVIYENGINKTPFTKRMSIIADKIKNKS